MSNATYQYQYGDRPLEGYTIQRAAGRGGFGEVYYAISDSGRQVALKVIQNCSQIELRGISQCMNLKSPHLISIFDIKYNEQGVPFVIMEYVSGPSLRQLLDESPQGLGEQKAAFFLREIAKGLTYLHECGIVHRDLKPANIFYENGYVKIGDYGLSKIINADHHTGQTITVGTVHYMAPEIGVGNYDSGIDIYALGIMLYEMLTGQVPYFGASPGEILMKHLSNEPDLSGINSSFARVIRKALAKDPNERYSTVREMLEDVFGSEYIRNSISQFSPDDLSDIAKKAAEKMQEVRAKASRNKVTPPPEGAGTQDYYDYRQWKEFERGQGRRKSSQAQRGKVKSDWREGIGLTGRDCVDPMGAASRIKLALLTMLMVAGGTSILVTGPSLHNGFSLMIYMGLTMTGATVIMLWARWSILSQMEPSFFRNLLVCGFGAIGTLIGNVIVLGLMGNTPRNLFISALSILLLSLVDVWKVTQWDRPQRISLSRAVIVSVIGMVTAAFIGAPDPLITGGVLAGIMLMLQVISPYIPQESRHYYQGRVVSGAVPAGGRSQTAADNKPPVPASNETDSPAGAGEYYSISSYNQVRRSSKKRSTALVLALVLGWMGVHRFYVGKTGSGVLWMCTVGMFGIGYLYDVIMISSGEFRDDRGRRITRWFDVPDEDDSLGMTPDPELLDSRLNQSAYYYGGEFQPLSALIGFLGGLILLVAVLTGLIVVLQVPQFIAQAMPDAARDIQRDLFNDWPDWPQLVNKFATIASVVLFFAAVTGMVIGRRNRGPAHIIRAVIGVGLLGMCLGVLSEAIPNHYSAEMIQQFRTGQFVGGIDLLLNEMNSEPLVYACVQAGLTLVILGWPAKRRMPLTVAGNSVGRADRESGGTI